MAGRERELEILLHFIESTYFSQSLPELLQASAEFFVNKFGLANVYLELFGKYYRFFTNNQITEEYRKIENSIKGTLQKNRVPVFIPEGMPLPGIEDSRYYNVSAYPICIGKEYVGEIFLYGSKLFESESKELEDII